MAKPGNGQYRIRLGRWRIRYAIRTGLVEGYVAHYNNARLKSAIGYITPKDVGSGLRKKLEAQAPVTHDARKLQRPSPAGL